MEPSRSLKDAVFLDRDGVINRIPPDLFVKTWDEFEFLPGVFSPLRRLTKAGFLLFVVSNQSGLGRGIIRWEDFQEINRRMLEACRKEGVSISGIYFCPHLPDAGCPCRKPKPTLLELAAKDFRLDLLRSFFVGDQARDIEAGQAAGCRTIFVTTGQETREHLPEAGGKPDQIVDSIEEAATWILDTHQ